MDILGTSFFDISWGMHAIEAPLKRVAEEQDWRGPEEAQGPPAFLLATRGVDLPFPSFPPTSVRTRQMSAAFVWDLLARDIPQRLLRSPKSKQGHRPVSHVPTHVRPRRIVVPNL